MAIDINRVLLLGGGPTNIGNENELDAATLARLSALKKNGTKVIYVDNNPFSVTAEEIQPANIYVKEVNFANVTNIINKEKPDAIMATTGGLNAMQVAWQLVESGILKDNNIKLLGIKPKNLQVTMDNEQLRSLLKEINENIIASKIISDEQGAIDFVRDVGLPVIVKPLSSNHDTNRFICNTEEELEDALSKSFSYSYIEHVSIEQSIVGYKEIEMVGVRDQKGDKVLVSGLEDMDPIGIHSGDSIIFAPTQTLINEEYQTLRTATFRIMDSLGITGCCHIQFALNSETSNYFVTKVSPFFTRSTLLAEKASGYPISFISAFLEMGYLLTEIKLPSRFNKFTPFMEPTSDHIVVKIPVWPFEDVPETDKHLNTMMKSVGSTIGIGRSVEEALMKAMHSSQFSPRDILPSVTNMDEDELINQLIHPLSSRILILMEALRRGYSTDELAELTKIDSFYFYKMRQLIRAQDYVNAHPLTKHAVDVGHQYGLGDGMLAQLWHVNISSIRQINLESNFNVTFKQLEPSAGEMIQDTNIYYSSYELENESEPFEEKSALVIGRGGNQLGPNSAADYYTSEILITLHHCGFKTIIMNNNPNAVSLISQLSNKQYIEPIQLGNILNIIELEKPDVVFLPGNRHFLARELVRRNNRHMKIVVLPADQKIATFNARQATNSVITFVDGKDVLPITTFSFLNDDSDRHLSKIINFKEPMETWQQDESTLFDEAKERIDSEKWQGLVEVLFDRNETGHFDFVGIRPTRITQTALLSKTTGINWVAILVRKYIGKLDVNQVKDALNNRNPQRFAIMKAEFPFKKIGSPKLIGNNHQEVGSSLTFENFSSGSRANL